MKKSKLAERLRELRGGDSQSVFACKIGAKQTTYSAWECGKQEPNCEMLIHIASIFSASIDWLVGLVDAPRAHFDTSARPDADSGRVQELEAEVARLNGEVAGLRYALDAISSTPSSKEKRKGAA